MLDKQREQEVSREIAPMGDEVTTWPSIAAREAAWGVGSEQVSWKSPMQPVHNLTR